ncbi:hypothetical protein [Prevotella veroralis]|uniref:hypothetical protein n=1 Tax=Prevotella veroralis TaxID=28137 RepID=UPI0012DE1FAE|nr:hypothetical protein [Prevotella veroralis]
MVIYLNGSFYPKECHRVGTDALVWKPHPASPKGGVPNGNLFEWFFLSKGMPQSRDRRLVCPSKHS